MACFEDIYSLYPSTRNHSPPYGIACVKEKYPLYPSTKNHTLSDKADETSFNLKNLVNYIHQKKFIAIIHHTSHEEIKVQIKPCHLTTALRPRGAALLIKVFRVNLYQLPPTPVPRKEEDTTEDLVRK